MSQFFGNQGFSNFLPLENTERTMVLRKKRSGLFFIFFIPGFSHFPGNPFLGLG
jgi:hypothetical protein